MSPHDDERVLYSSTRAEAEADAAVRARGGVGRA
jgi:hypothetical protein